MKGSGPNPRDGEEISSPFALPLAESGASNRRPAQDQFGDVMAEMNCVECGRLHDTYNAATIRYMKFYECTSNTRDVQQGNQLFTEMTDAMLAYLSHERTRPLAQAATR